MGGLGRGNRRRLGVCMRKTHAEMKRAKLIRLERRMVEKGWKQINEVRGLDNLTDFKELHNYEQREGIN